MTLWSSIKLGPYKGWSYLVKYRWPLLWAACVIVPAVCAFKFLENPKPWYVASVASLVALCPYCFLSLVAFVPRWFDGKEKWNSRNAFTAAMVLLFLGPMAMGGFWIAGGLVWGLAYGKWASVICSLIVMVAFLAGDLLGEKYTTGDAQQAYARNVRYLDVPFCIGLLVLFAVNAVSLWFTPKDADYLSAFTGGASALQLVVQNTAYALTNKL